MAGANKAGKCENNYCQVPGWGVVPANLLRRTEVTVGEMRAFLAKSSGAALSVVLSGCSFLKPEELVVKGRPGEDESALLRRASQIATSENCNGNGLKEEPSLFVDRIRSERMI